MLPLLLSEKELFEHFESLGTPLRFSLSSLQKDRGEKKPLGGIPYRHFNGIKYCPDEVERHVRNLPVYRGSSAAKHRVGRPTKTESQLAKDLGLSIRELRSRRASERKSTK